MSDSNTIGSAGWFDLTVEDAESIRDFYAKVVGWSAESVDMGGYSDYNMCLPTSGTPVGGVCHARGVNADLPPVWLIYVNVLDLDASIKSATSLGGSVVTGPHEIGGQGRYAIIFDPAGAAIGLLETASKG